MTTLKSDKAFPIIGLVLCLTAVVTELLLILSPGIPVSFFFGINFKNGFIPEAVTPYAAYAYLVISFLLCFMAVIVLKSKKLKLIRIIGLIILAAGFSAGNLLDNAQWFTLSSKNNILTSFFFESSAVSHIFSGITLAGALFILCGTFIRTKSRNSIFIFSVISSVSIVIYLSAVIIISLTNNNEFYLSGYTFLPSSVLFLIFNILNYKEKNNFKGALIANIVSVTTLIFSPFISAVITGDYFWVMSMTALSINSDFFVPLWFIGALMCVASSYKGVFKNERGLYNERLE